MCREYSTRVDAKQEGRLLLAGRVDSVARAAWFAGRCHRRVRSGSIFEYRYGESSMQARSGFFISLLVVFACSSVIALAQQAVRSGNWSDSSKWSGGVVPQAGGIVTIGDDMEVILDTSTPMGFR